MALTRDVVGFEGFYSISETSRVYRIKSHYGTQCFKPLKPRSELGYLRYTLCVESKPQSFFAHRMVWEAFVGPIPEGMQINHKDGRKDNNLLDNLELCTSAENNAHAIQVLKKRIGSLCGNAKLTEDDIPTILRLYEKGNTQQVIADLMGVGQMTISRVIRGVFWKHVSR